MHTTALILKFADMEKKKAFLCKRGTLKGEKNLLRRRSHPGISGTQEREHASYFGSHKGRQMGMVCVRYQRQRDVTEHGPNRKPAISAPAHPRTGLVMRIGEL